MCEKNDATFVMSNAVSLTDKPISEFDTNWYSWWCIQWLAKILGWNQVDLNMVYLMCLTAIFPFWQGCQKHMFSQKQFNSFGGTFKDRDVHSWFYDKGPSLNALKSVSFKKTVKISSTQEICTEFTHIIYCKWVNSVQISWVLEISTVFLKETDFNICLVS